MADSKSAALGHLATPHQIVGAQGRTRTGKLARQFLRLMSFPISPPGQSSNKPCCHTLSAVDKHNIQPRATNVNLLKYVT